MRTGRRRLVALTAGAALALGLVGCTTSDDATTDRATADSATADRAATDRATRGEQSDEATPAATTGTGAFTHVFDFGSNPGGLSMYQYLPAELADPAPVVVAIHYCSGSAQDFRTTGIEQLADSQGFVVVYPQADRLGHCFDVSSTASLTRDGGGDSQSIAQMVEQVQGAHHTDSGRVFVFGYSSGAMMTEVLLAAYPDVFAAGAAFAGVPAGCAATSDPPPGPLRPVPRTPECWGGQVDHTPQEWGDLAHAMDPAWTGPRPRVQLWHGTDDAVLLYPNFGEAVEQWTNVLGVSAEPVSTVELDGGWTRTRYGADGDQPPVEAYSLQGGTHTFAVDVAAMARFFGLDG